jgi:hypothetical protein
LWTQGLRADLERAEVSGAAAVQGDLVVPTPRDRRPTDWERQVAGLATGSWITADIAYRRDILDHVGGFDERFPRAYREDADLALRVRRSGHRLIRGSRRALHPIGPAGPWASLTRQAGNADDALLRRLHGRHWRSLAGVPAGRRYRHAAITAAGLIGVGAALAGRRGLARGMGIVWIGGTAEFALRRILPGPRTPREVLTMLATSVLIPPVAVAYWTRGWITHWRARPFAPRGAA